MSHPILLLSICFFFENEKKRPSQMGAGREINILKRERKKKDTNNNKKIVKKNKRTIEISHFNPPFE